MSDYPNFDGVENETFMSYSFNVKAIRVIGGFLSPTSFDVRMEIAAVPGVDEHAAQLALDKMAYWLDMLSKSVMLCTANRAGLDIVLDAETSAPRVDNYLALMPYDPDDETVAIILHAKLSALCEGVFVFGSVDIKADTSGGMAFVFMGDSARELPPMEDWVPGPNWFDLPWWHRNDASMLDSTPPDGVDLNIAPSWAFSLDFLAKRPAEKPVVVAGKFKPTVIDGGPK